jgi:hypothetical protein
VSPACLRSCVRSFLFLPADSVAEADLELEVPALRRQLKVLRRQGPAVRGSRRSRLLASPQWTRARWGRRDRSNSRRAGTRRKSRTATPQSYGLPTSADLYRVHPAEKANSRKLALFALNQRDREFESTPLRQRVPVFGRNSVRLGHHSDVWRHQRKALTGVSCAKRGQSLCWQLRRFHPCPTHDRIDSTTGLAEM